MSSCCVKKCLSLFAFTMLMSGINLGQEAEVNLAMLVKHIDDYRSRDFVLQVEGLLNDLEAGETPPTGLVNLRIREAHLEGLGIFWKEWGSESLEPELVPTNSIDRPLEIPSIWMVRMVPDRTTNKPLQFIRLATSWSTGTYNSISHLNQKDQEAVLKMIPKGDYSLLGLVSVLQYKIGVGSSCDQAVDFFRKLVLEEEKSLPDRIYSRWRSPLGLQLEIDFNKGVHSLPIEIRIYNSVRPGEKRIVTNTKISWKKASVEDVWLQEKVSYAQHYDQGRIEEMQFIFDWRIAKSNLAKQSLRSMSVDGFNESSSEMSREVNWNDIFLKYFGSNVLSTKD